MDPDSTSSKPNNTGRCTTTVEKLKQSKHKLEWKIDDLHQLLVNIRTSSNFELYSPMIISREENGDCKIWHMCMKKFVQNGTEALGVWVMLDETFKVAEQFPSCEGGSLKVHGKMYTLIQGNDSQGVCKTYNKHEHELEQLVNGKLYMGCVKLHTGHEKNCSLVIAANLEMTEKQSTLTESVKTMHDKREDRRAGFGFLLRSGQMTDVVLIADDGQRFPAHRVVLAASSEVFRAMFNSNTVEKEQHVIAIRHIKSATVRHMVEYIYFGDIPPNADPAVYERLLAAADMYALDELKRMSQVELIGTLTVERIFNVIVLANKYRCPQMRRIAHLMFKHNFESAVKTAGWENLVECGWIQFSEQQLCCSREDNEDYSKDTDSQTSR